MGGSTFTKSQCSTNFSRQCLLCRSADYISTQPRLTRAQWQAGVAKLQQKYGAPLQTNSGERLVDYLTKNCGRDPVAK